MRNRIILLVAMTVAWNWIAPIQSGPISAYQAGFGRNINRVPCTAKNESGVCMFAFACKMANGTHLGTCMDGFYFGSCCSLKGQSNHSQVTTTTTAATTAAHSEISNGLNDISRPTSTVSTAVSVSSIVPAVTESNVNQLSDLTSSSILLPSSTMDPLNSQVPLLTTLPPLDIPIGSATPLPPETVSLLTTILLPPSQPQIVTNGSPATPLVEVSTLSSTAGILDQDPLSMVAISQLPPLLDVTTLSNLQFSFSSTPGTPTSTGIAQNAQSEPSAAQPVSQPALTQSETDILTIAPPTNNEMEINTETSIDEVVHLEPVTDSDIDEAPEATDIPLTNLASSADVGSGLVISVSETDPSFLEEEMNEEDTTSSDIDVEDGTEPSESEEPAVQVPGENPSSSSIPSSTLTTTQEPASTTTSTQESTSTTPTAIPTTTSTSTTITTTTTTPTTTTEPTTTTTTETTTPTTTVTTTATTEPTTTSTTLSTTTTTTESTTTTTSSTTTPLPTVAPAVSISSTDNSTTVSGEISQDYHQVCGRPKYVYPTARIVGGTTAQYAQWPWQISLRQWRTTTFLHKCGAALLNENWAITAAHCVDNVQPEDLLLRMGEYDLATDEEDYPYVERKVQIVASHPQFDSRTFEYDLALLRFYDPVRFQPNILPICLPEGEPEFVGRTAYVTGWGRLYEDGPLPSKMQQVNVPVINNTDCEAMYRRAGYVEHIPNIFICAGYAEGKQDSCEGDSGGPLVIEDNNHWVLAGVISWGIGCAEANQPGVYTRITRFNDWITKIIVF